MVFENFLDVELSSAYRKEIDRGFDGEAEIYFANTLGIANRKSWSKNGVNTDLFLIYDSAISTAFNAAPLSKLSETIHKFIVLD